MISPLVILLVPFCVGFGVLLIIFICCCCRNPDCCQNNNSDSNGEYIHHDYNNPKPYEATPLPCKTKTYYGACPVIPMGAAPIYGSSYGSVIGYTDTVWNSV